jgi:uncharacterized membrane protein
MRHETTVDIQAPVETIWSVMSDVTQWPEPAGLKKRCEG